MSERMGGHDRNNDTCPLNDPETYANPATRGLPCTCPDPPSPEDPSIRREEAVYLPALETTERGTTLPCSTRNGSK